MFTWRDKGKDKVINEEQPLLSSNLTDNVNFDKAGTFFSQAKKTVFLTPQQEPFLLEEVQACIKSLVKLQEIAARKTKHTRGTHYGVSLIWTLIILGMFSLDSIALGFIFVMSAVLNDRLMPGLEKKLNNLLGQVDLNTSILDKEQIKAEEAQTAYWNFSQKMKPSLEAIENKIKGLFDQFLSGYYQGKSNCRWWTKEDGTGANFSDYYHGKGLSGSQYWCWMPRHNVVHPIERCNNIINESCSSWLEEEALEASTAPYRNRFEAATQAVLTTESSLVELQENINRIQDTMDHPDFQYEPYSKTALITLSVAAVVVLLIGSYACWQSSKNNSKASAQNNSLDVAITDPTLSARIINLSSRLGINDLRNMELQTLIDQLKIEESKLLDRRELVTTFLYGGLERNSGAGNHQFFKLHGSKDTIPLIYSYAFPKLGKQGIGNDD